MFLSGNTNIVVGSGETFILNKDELAGIAATKGDGYFGEKGFWRRVFCNFTSEGTVNAASIPQKKAMLFNGESDQASISFSSSAHQGQWFMTEVVILDKDGGELVIKREEIPNSNLYFLTITA